MDLKKALLQKAILDKVNGGSISQLSERIGKLEEFVIHNLAGYGWSAGDVVNEVDYENKQYVQKVGRVDLGALSYNAWASTVYADAYVENCKAVGNTVVANLSCEPYATKSYNDCITVGKTDSICVTTNGTICIRTSQEYTNVTEFRRAVNGTYLFYELAKPIVIDISDII